MAKIGVMGGTFDPIHIGHIKLAQCAKKEAALDRVLFVPSCIPWMKKDRGVTEEKHRIEMVKTAIQNTPDFSLSLVDIEAGGESYTYRTLELLKNTCPEDSFYFILGADSLFTIEKWKNPDKIFANAIILAAVRDDVDMDALQAQKEKLCDLYQARVTLLHMEQVEISSTFIREHFYDDEKACSMLVKETADYIRANQLYRREIG